MVICTTHSVADDDGDGGGGGVCACMRKKAILIIKGEVSVVATPSLLVCNEH